MFFRYCFVFITVFFISSVAAIEVTDLYVAKVDVASQSTKDRNIALKEAMKGVILKVGGQKSSLEHPVIVDALKIFTTYVSQYRYERVANNSVLNVSFDEKKINKLFVEANLPIWGSLRPQILLWLVNEQGLTRTILSESSLTSLPHYIEVFSDNRGLPIIMPLMDLTDNSEIDTSDVWGRFAQPIKLASKRYMAESVVIIRLSDSSLLPKEDSLNCTPICEPIKKTSNQDKKYALDWSFIADSGNANSQRFGKQYYGTDDKVLLEQALEDITENIYQRYALATNTKNEFTIDVANIETLTEYMQVSNFLMQLSAVNKIKLIQANGKNRRFTLTLMGSKHALLASLKLNKMLQQYIDPLAEVNFDDIPVFYWGKS